MVLILIIILGSHSSPTSPIIQPRPTHLIEVLSKEETNSIIVLIVRFLGMSKSFPL